VEQTIPTSGRLLGLDYGSRRIGIAVSDTDQSIASPLETRHRRGMEADARFFESLAAEYTVAGLVVGLPVHMSGDEGEQAREARAFGEWLSEITGCPVDWQDERYTSVMAQDLMQDAGLSRKLRRTLVDKLAARMLLQAWIDRRVQGNTGPPGPLFDAATDDD